MLRNTTGNSPQATCAQHPVTSPLIERK